MVEAHQLAVGAEVGGAGVGDTVAGKIGEHHLVVSPFETEAMDRMVAEAVDIRQLVFAGFQHDGDKGMAMRSLRWWAVWRGGEVVEAIMQHGAVNIAGGDRVEIGNPRGGIEKPQRGMGAQRRAGENVAAPHHGGVVVAAEVYRVGARRP